MFSKVGIAIRIFVVDSSFSLLNSRGAFCLLNSNFVIIQNVQFTFGSSNISNEINVSDIDARLATAKLILAFNKSGSAPMIIGLNALKTKVALFSTNVASVGTTITVNLLLIM